MPNKWRSSNHFPTSCFWISAFVVGSTACDTSRAIPINASAKAVRNIDVYLHWSQVAHAQSQLATSLSNFASGIRHKPTPVAFDLVEMHSVCQKPQPPERYAKHHPGLL